jgi:hypothetical protein
MRHIEQLEAAEAKMNAAKESLLSYVEQRKVLDADQYRRLVARVKKAEAEFIRAVSGDD